MDLATHWATFFRRCHVLFLAPAKGTQLLVKILCDMHVYEHAECLTCLNINASNCHQLLKDTHTNTHSRLYTCSSCGYQLTFCVWGMSIIVLALQSQHDKHICHCLRAADKQSTAEHIHTYLYMYDICTYKYIYTGITCVSKCVSHLIQSEDATKSFVCIESYFGRQVVEIVYSINMYMLRKL